MDDLFSQIRLHGIQHGKPLPKNPVLLLRLYDDVGRMLAVHVDVRDELRNWSATLEAATLPEHLEIRPAIDPSNSGISLANCLPSEVTAYFSAEQWLSSFAAIRELTAALEVDRSINPEMWDLVELLGGDPRKSVTANSFDEAKAGIVKVAFALLKCSEDLCATLSDLRQRAEAAIEALAVEETSPRVRRKRRKEVPQYVTLDQMAAICGYKAKRTAERWKTDGKLPMPDVEGGGGKADQWIWENVRLVLEEITGKTLPDEYPSLIGR